MMTSPLHRRAAAVMAAMVLLGCLLGAYISGRRLAGNIEELFYQGAKDNGVGVASDLSHRVECCRNLITVANRYLAPDSLAVTAAQRACSDADGAGTLTEKHGADGNLRAAFMSLCDTLAQQALSDKDEAYRKSIYADFTSYGDTMSHDPYNDAAVKYNRDIAAFPGRLFFKLMGIEKAPVFR